MVHKSSTKVICIPFEDSFQFVYMIPIRHMWSLLTLAYFSAAAWTSLGTSWCLPPVAAHTVRIQVSHLLRHLATPQITPLPLFSSNFSSLLAFCYQFHNRLQSCHILPLQQHSSYLSAFLSYHLPTFPLSTSWQWKAPLCPMNKHIIWAAILTASRQNCPKFNSSSHYLFLFLRKAITTPPPPPRTWCETARNLLPDLISEYTQK